MYYNPMLPKVQVGTLNSITHELETSPDWMTTMLNKIRIHDPIMGEYFDAAVQRNESDSIIIGLVVYRILESQIEANNLNELFSD